MTDHTTEAETADLAAQAGYLRDQLAVLAAKTPVPLPTAEELAAGATADKVTAARIHAARPGIPVHHVFAVLQALRAVRALDRAPNPDREDRIPLDRLTEEDLELLYDDLDRYTEVVGELNEANTELARRAASAEALAATPRELALRQRSAWVAAGRCPMCGDQGTDGRLCPDCTTTVRAMRPAERREWRRYEPPTTGTPIQGHGYTPAGLLGLDDEPAPAAATQTTDDRSPS